MKHLIFGLSILLAQSAYAGGKTVWECRNVSNKGGLEGLWIKSDAIGVLTAYVEVSGPGDYIEGYYYIPGTPPVLSEQTHLSGTNFDLTYLTPVRGGTLRKLTAVGPVRSRLYPNVKFSYKVLCTAPKN